jgi:hypothetical protein
MRLFQGLLDHGLDVGSFVVQRSLDIRMSRANAMDGRFLTGCTCCLLVFEEQAIINGPLQIRN